MPKPVNGNSLLFGAAEMLHVLLDVDPETEKFKIIFITHPKLKLKGPIISLSSEISNLIIAMLTPLIPDKNLKMRFLPAIVFKKEIENTKAEIVMMGTKPKQEGNGSVNFLPLKPSQILIESPKPDK